MSRDRARDSISLGMGGGISLPRPIPQEVIRREGRRLGFGLTALEDFVEIVVGIDDCFVETTVRREAENASAAAKRTSKPKR